MSLHLGKTEAILFGSKRKLKSAPVLDINCSGNKLENKTSVKYLGIELDQNLSGDCVAKSAISKIDKKLKFLYRNTKSFDLKTKRLLVSALIQCHFDYACSSWYSGISKYCKSKLQIMQNKSIRYMLNLSPRSHIGIQEFKKVDMLPVELRVKQLKLNHIFNVVHNSAPNYLSISFIRDQHSINTRSGRNAAVIPAVKSHGITSFVYTASKAWNELPNNIQTVHSKSVFKQHVKRFLSLTYECAYNSAYLYF